MILISFLVKKLCSLWEYKKKSIANTRIVTPLQREGGKTVVHEMGNSGDAEGVSNIVQNNDAVSGKQPTVEIKG